MAVTDLEETLSADEESVSNFDKVIIGGSIIYVVGMVSLASISQPDATAVCCYSASFLPVAAPMGGLYIISKMMYGSKI